MLRGASVFLGFASEWQDQDGEGPANVWRSDDERIIVISCKNERKLSSPVHKKDAPLNPPSLDATPC
jgi:hypothetical protein